MTGRHVHDVATALIDHLSYGALGDVIATLCGSEDGAVM